MDIFIVVVVVVLSLCVLRSILFAHSICFSVCIWTSMNMMMLIRATENSYFHFQYWNNLFCIFRDISVYHQYFATFFGVVITFMKVPKRGRLKRVGGPAEPLDIYEHGMIRYTSLFNLIDMRDVWSWVGRKLSKFPLQYSMGPFSGELSSIARIWLVHLLSALGLIIWSHHNFHEIRIIFRLLNYRLICKHSIPYIMYFSMNISGRPNDDEY